MYHTHCQDNSFGKKKLHLLVMAQSFPSLFRVNRFCNNCASLMYVVGKVVENED